MNAPVHIGTTPTRYRLLVEDFLLLDESGAFEGYAKTELIDGEIFGMNSQFAGHARVKSRLYLQLANALIAIRSDFEAIVEVTMRVAPDGAPEPDIVLTQWREPGVVPADTVALVIEVSDTTLAVDLGRKAALYAAAGIPEYWVVDVSGQRVVAHTRPQADSYAESAEVAFGAPLVSATLAGLTVDTGVLRL